MPERCRTQQFGTRPATAAIWNPNAGLPQDDLGERSRLARLILLHLCAPGLGADPWAEATQPGQTILDACGGSVTDAVNELIATSARTARRQSLAGRLQPHICPAPKPDLSDVMRAALTQCRLVASIAHLYGHNPRREDVRAAVLSCLVPPQRIQLLVDAAVLPGGPRVLLRRPGEDGVDLLLAEEVFAALLERRAGPGSGRGWSPPRTMFAWVNEAVQAGVVARRLGWNAAAEFGAVRGNRQARYTVVRAQRRQGFPAGPDVDGLEADTLARHS